MSEKIELNIKDYLHYYLGCEVEYCGILNGRELGIEKKANKDDFFFVPTIQEVLGTKRGVLKILEVTVEGKLIRARVGRRGLKSYYGTPDFKLILRSLWDITEDEALWIADLVYTDLVPKEERIRIGKDFINYNLLDCGLSSTRSDKLKEFSTKEDFKISHYLLSRHFDLFDLIPNGLAIDKKQTQ